MGSDTVGRLVGIAAGGLTMWGVYALVSRVRAPDHRRQQGERWARRHQAYVDPRWVPAVDAQLQANRRMDLLGAGVMCVVMVQLPTSLKAYAACLVTLPVLLAGFRGLTATRHIALSPGTRVARLRELTLSDYLPRRSRILMWVSGAAGGAATAYLAVVQGHPLMLGSTLLLVLAPLSVERAGARLARQPEPAEDSAHLYWQDAFRSDLLRSAAAMTMGSACLLCLLEPALLGGSPLIHWWDSIWWLVGGGLLLFALIDEGGLRERPAAYMRSRLWPMLTEHQVLRSGDPVPSVGGTP